MSRSDIMQEELRTPKVLTLEIEKIEMSMKKCPHMSDR